MKKLVKILPMFLALSLLAGCGEDEQKPCEHKNWGEWVVTKEATHLEEGEKKHTCADCGEVKTEKINKISEHTYGAWTKVDDNTHSKTCACGDVVSENHKWNSGVETTPATHTANGVKTYTCTECGATKEEKINKITEHSYGDWTKVDDNTHSKTCACGDELTEAHDWVAGNVTVSPNPQKPGVREYKCSKCNATKDVPYELTKEEEKIYGYGMVLNSYCLLETYEGSFTSENMWYSNSGNWEEKIAYNSENKEAYFSIQNCNNDGFDNKIEMVNIYNQDNNSYQCAVYEQPYDSKRIFNSSGDMIDCFKRCYLDRDDIIGLENGTNAEDDYVFPYGNFGAHTSLIKRAYLNQNTYEDSLQYFKEYNTFLTNTTFAELADITSYETEADIDVKRIVSTIDEEPDCYEITYSFLEIGDAEIPVSTLGDGTTTIESLITETYTIKENYLVSTEYSLEIEMAFTPVSGSVLSQKLSATHMETFDYDFDESIMPDNFDGYETVDEYPVYATKLNIVYNHGSTFNSRYPTSTYYGAFNPEQTVYADLLIEEDYAGSLSNHCYDKSSESTLYTNKECTNVFTSSKMTCAGLTLYTNKPLIEDYVYYFEGVNFIPTVYSDFKYASEILNDFEFNYFQCRVNKKDCGPDYNPGDAEALYIGVRKSYLGYQQLASITVDGVVMSQEQLNNGEYPDMHNGSVIVWNYELVAKPE